MLAIDAKINLNCVLIQSVFPPLKFGDVGLVCQHHAELVGEGEVVEDGPRAAALHQLVHGVVEVVGAEPVLLLDARLRHQDHLGVVPEEPGLTYHLV